MTWALPSLVVLTWVALAGVFGFGVAVARAQPTYGAMPPREIGLWASVALAGGALFAWAALGTALVA